MTGLVEKIKKGDYYIPTTLSKEAISFLNCMIRNDSKERLNIDILYNHKFLRIYAKDFTKLELKYSNSEQEIIINIYLKKIRWR